MVLDMLSGNRFPLLVESTIMHPPLSPARSQQQKQMKASLRKLKYE
jgi:hypothetical protein